MKKKKRTTLLSRRKLANMIESYAAIVALPDVDVKGYAKAAIRDIFIQMPSRSVNLNNWNGYKNYISGFFGEDNYNIAMKELQNEGWITKGDTRYEWKHMYGPVGTIPKKDHINEWADSIKTDKFNIDYKEEGTYPFIYDIKHYSVNFGKHMMTHATILNIGNKFGDNMLQGRVWTREKILSLWEYPDTKSMYIAMIKKINEEMKKLNIGKIDGSWKIELPNVAVDFLSNNMFQAMDKAKKSAEVDNFRDIKSFLIPVFDWSPDIMKNPKSYKNEFEAQKIQHMMSPVAKISNVSDKIGSKKTPAGLSSTQRHQMKSTSEQLEEWADKIDTGGKEYIHWDKDSHPFGYKRFSPDKIVVGDNGKTHRGSGIDPDRDISLGRIWEKDKIISFWEYPSSLAKLKKIVNDINDNLKNNPEYTGRLLDNSWKIDIPKLKFNLHKLDMINNQGAIVNKQKLKSPTDKFGNIYDIESELVPIFNYSPKMITNAEEFNKAKDNQLMQHMLSPIAKKSNVQNAIGSKKTPAGLSATQRHQMKSTSENIKESPDNIAAEFNGKDIRFSWFDKENYSFGYYKGKFNIKRGVSHYNMKILRKIKGQKRPVEREKFKYPGRIWPTEKIISFWSYPENKDKLYNILSDIEKNTKIKINPSKWRIDVLLPYNSKNVIKNIMRKNGAYDVSLLDDSDEVLIPVEEYEGSPDNDMNIIHMASPIIKSLYNIEIPSGIGSKKIPGGLTPTQMHQMKTTSENKLNEIQTEYGCLMLKVNISWWKDFVEAFIKDEDVYNNPAQEYGREYAAHITILYGFTENVDVEKIKKILYTLKNPIKAVAYKIGMFNTKEYDVIKFDIESKELNKLNEIITKNFEYVQLHKVYSPHMTISYVKPGTGDKYVKRLKNPIRISSSEFIYSYAGGEKETFNILKSS